MSISKRGHEVQIEHGSPEWLNLRTRLRMASETPAILGLSPYQTAAKIRDAKLGERQYVNPAMRKGTEQEPIARAAYAKTFEPVRPAFFVAGEYGCSLDGISQNGATIVEIKTPFRGRDNDRWRLATNGQTREDDYAQIQHQLMVCRAAIAHLWVWDAESREGRLVAVEPSSKYWRRIRAAWDAFWPSLGRRQDIL